MVRFDTLPDFLILKISDSMPRSGVPSEQLLLMGRVSKVCREAVRAQVCFQLNHVYGKKYKSLKVSYLYV